MKKYRPWFRSGILGVLMCAVMGVVFSLFVAGNAESARQVLRQGASYFANIVLIIVPMYNLALYHTLLPLTLSLGSDRRTACRGLAMSRAVAGVLCLLFGGIFTAPFGRTLQEGLLLSVALCGLCLVNSGLSSFFGLLALKKGRLVWQRITSMLLNLPAVAIISFFIFASDTMNTQRLMIAAGVTMAVGIIFQLVAWNTDKSMLKRYNVKL